MVALAAIVSGAVLVGDRPALAQGYAPTRPDAGGPRSAVVAQASPAPTTAPVGLPPVRDYQLTSELRDIYFDFAKARIRPEDEAILDANAAWLRAHPQYLVLIEGHCDNRGASSRKNELNMVLGERRAEAAMKYLVSRGVHPSRITILSYGEELPVCAQDNEACWRQNRRARFLVKPR